MDARLMFTGALICAGVFAAQDTIPISLSRALVPPPDRAVLSDLVLRFDEAMPAQMDLMRLVRSPGDTTWHLAERHQLRPVDRRAAVRAQAGVETLLLLQAAGKAGYLLHGPLRWPDRDAHVDVDMTWRRTVRGRWPRPGAAPPVWLAPAEDSRQALSAWPVCSWRAEDEWECAGVPLAARGVVFSSTPAETVFGIAMGHASLSGVEFVAAQSSGWGRMLIVTRADRVPLRPGAGVLASARRLQIPRARRPPIRAHTEADPDIQVSKLSEGVFWIAGAATPAETWIEVTAAGRAPARMDIPALVDGSAELPASIQLAEAGAIAGRVTDATGTAAPGAIVTLYRLIPDRRSDRNRPPRRVAVAEMPSDMDGAFHFVDVSREPHEVMGWHSAAGRGERSVETDGPEIQLVLRPSARVTGRVLRDGVPAAGVPVATVPDLSEFAASEDVTELFGGEAATDRDGRFNVPAGARGIVELRVGDSAMGVRRLTLGAAESLPPVTDVGVVDLSPLPALTLVLEESSGCELTLTGPIGSSGVSLHRATRLGPAMYRASLPEPGDWLLSATCPGRAREIAPATINMPAHAAERTVQVFWK